MLTSTWCRLAKKLVFLRLSRRRLCPLKESDSQGCRCSLDVEQQGCSREELRYHRLVHGIDRTSCSHGGAYVAWSAHVRSGVWSRCLRWLTDRQGLPLTDVLLYVREAAQALGMDGAQSHSFSANRWCRGRACTICLFWGGRMLRGASKRFVGGAR